jgi:hypothetical protein
MGQEIKCRVDYGTESSTGKALLETSELIFRGDFRLKIPFRSITAMEAAAGKLTVGFDEGPAIFHLGEAAAKWAEKIRNPPGRLDKLGVKPGMKVQLLGRHDDDFRRELADRGAAITRSKPDLVFLAIAKKDDLVELAYLADAPVWIIYPKGVDRVTQGDVITAGRAAGLVDTKVCAFSPAHTALHFKPRTAAAKASRHQQSRTRLGH